MGEMGDMEPPVSKGDRLGLFVIGALCFAVVVLIGWCVLHARSSAKRFESVQQELKVLKTRVQTIDEARLPSEGAPD